MAHAFSVRPHESLQRFWGSASFLLPALCRSGFGSKQGRPRGAPWMLTMTFEPFPPFGMIIPEFLAGELVQ